MIELSNLPAVAFAAPLFDAAQFAVLGELGEEGDTEIILEVVNQFLTDADHTLAELRDGIESQDFGMIIRVAHTLKGSLAIFGLMRAQALAREIEHLAESSRLDRMPALSRALVGCFRAGKQDLLSHMADPSLLFAGAGQVVTMS